MYSKLLALLTLLQIATRPVSVMAAVAILVFQYILLPHKAQQLGVHCQYMSDIVASALVAKIIAYYAGRTVEKIKGAANALQL